MAYRLHSPATCKVLMIEICHHNTSYRWYICVSEYINAALYHQITTITICGCKQRHFIYYTHKHFQIFLPNLPFILIDDHIWAVSLARLSHTCLDIFFYVSFPHTDCNDVATGHWKGDLNGFKFLLKVSVFVNMG